MNSSTLYHPATSALPQSLSSRRHRFTPFSKPFSASIRRPLRRPLRRHHRRNLLKKPLPTTTPPPLPPSTPLPSSTSPDQKTLIHSKFYLNQFISSSQDAIHDLRTLITFDNGNNYNYGDSVAAYNGYSYSYGDGTGSGVKRVVVSCKRSTLEFIGAVLVSSFVAVYAVKVVLKIGGVLFFGWGRRAGGEGNVVYKRDRSLGGKLVAVGSNEGNYGSGSGYAKGKSDDGEFWDWGEDVKEWRSQRGKTARLPKWWPKEIVGSGIGRMLDEEEKEEYQKLANRLIRGFLLPL